MVVVAFDINYVSSFNDLDSQISCLLYMRIDNAESIKNLKITANLNLVIEIILKTFYFIKFT